jgi:hypothetical protein
MKTAASPAINGHCLGRRPLLSLSPIRVVPKPLLLLLHLSEHPSSLVLSPSTNRHRRRGEALCRHRLLPLSVLLSPFSFSRCTRRTTRTPPRRPGARSRGRNPPPRRATVIPTAPRRRTTSTLPHRRHRAAGELRTILLLLPVQSASQIVAPSSRTPFPAMLRRVFRPVPPRAGCAATPAVPPSLASPRPFSSPPGAN